MLRRRTASKAGTFAYRSLATTTESRAKIIPAYGAVILGVASWKRIYAFVFTNPAMLTLAFLLTARRPFAVLGRGAFGHDGVRLANMESFLLHGTNGALQDLLRGIANQMLVAVAVYAPYGVKHSNGARHRIHMHGLLQINNLRGGLREIGQQDSYLERVLLRQDANTVMLVDVQDHLQNLDRGLNQSSSRPLPNLKRFQLR